MSYIKREAIVFFTQNATIKSAKCLLPYAPKEEDWERIRDEIEGNNPSADVMAIIELPIGASADDFQITDLFKPGHRSVIHVFDE